jgi:CheY-like chemotaxis protein
VVLVVEDEFLIRTDAADMVRAAGFTVVEASNADLALQLLESSSDIAAVFTDIHMPGSMDGLRLVAIVRDRWPPIAVLVTSGQDQIGIDDLPVGGRFLPKPYTEAQLATHLRELTSLH